MGELSSESEERVVEQLILIEWVRDLDSVSYRIVCHLCGCSVEEAKDIVRSLVDRRLIEKVGGYPNPGARLDSYRSAWMKGSVPTG